MNLDQTTARIKFLKVQIFNWSEKTSSDVGGFSS